VQNPCTTDPGSRAVGEVRPEMLVSPAGSHRSLRRGRRSKEKEGEIGSTGWIGLTGKGLKCKSVEVLYCGLISSISEGLNKTDHDDVRTYEPSHPRIICRDINSMV
jgi:hypothetical protein